MSDATRISGGCHCGNIRHSLEWPEPLADIGIRECGCSFCRKHGGAWTSHRGARLIASLRSMDEVSKYRFGTATADFFVCARCGAVPFVTSEIDGRLYAVVNVNCFEDVDTARMSRASTDFDGEGTGDRLARRRRNWIADVQIRVTGT